MNSRHLMFIRHGETLGNYEAIAHGQTESPLNERGIQQARHTADLLENWAVTYDRIYASPLSRAQDTAKLINAKLRLPLHTEAGLMEADLGDWEGATYEQLRAARYMERSIADDHFSGGNGESSAAIAARVSLAISEVFSRHPEENIILVSHGGAICHAMASLLGTRPLFGYQYLMHNSAVTELKYGDAPEITCLNHFEHLPAELRSDPTGTE